MKKNFILVTLLCLLWLVNGCTTQIRTGEIIACNKCDKIISDNTVLIKVEYEKQNQYFIKHTSRLCETCLAQNLSDPKYVSQQLFDAMKNRNTEELSKYTDYGEINRKLSIVIPRIDDTCIKGPIEYMNGNPTFVIGSTRVNYKFDTWSMRATKEYTHNGNKIVAKGARMHLHLVNNKYVIFDITEEYDDVITE